MQLKSSFLGLAFSLIASALVACSSSTSPAGAVDSGSDDATTYTDAAPMADGSCGACPVITADAATDAPTNETDAQADSAAATDSGLDGAATD